MLQLLRALNITRRTRPQFMLAILAALLITAVACGTDRADGDGVAASSFQVEGNTLTWAPPWNENDSRSINVTSSFELSPATQDFFDRIEDEGGDRPEFPAAQTSTVGTVTIVSKGSNGSTGEFNASIENLMNQLENQSFEQPGFGDADSGQFATLLAFADQLDLGVEFGIDANGTVTGVTNLAELAAEINEFANTLMRLAAFADEEFMAGDEIEQLKTLLEELPKTDAAQLAADSAINLATANMFLMRAGQYTVGQPVIVSGKTPTFVGIATDGTFSYELTGVSGDTATVDVLVAPGQIDLLELMKELSVELTEAAGEDSAEVAEGMDMIDPDERALFNAIANLVFEPYTVTLTLDTETGWVTAADWNIELSVPEGVEELIEDDSHDLDGFDLADLAVTVVVSTRFENAP